MDSHSSFDASLLMKSGNISGAQGGVAQDLVCIRVGGRFDHVGWWNPCAPSQGRGELLEFTALRMTRRDEIAACTQVGIDANLGYR